MNRNFLMATVAGTVVLMIVGYVLYGMLLMDFFTANTGTATNVVKDPPGWLWLILGQFITAALIALVLGWKGATDTGSGAKTAAFFGLVLSLGYGLTMLGTTNISNLTATLVDPFVAVIQFGAAGAVIGMMLGKDSSIA
ncbi:MAG: hypothetical protein R3195_05545 [Gemmatimonadota bacterium]|nr:hypothetical protein [Gemmatimonadota bacterium]